MTTTEAAARQGVSRSTVARWARLSLIDAVKVRGRWVVKSLTRITRAVTKTVEAVAEIVAPAEPRRSLWSWRREHIGGF